MARPDAVLVLEDGRVFRGGFFGCATETIGEVVFNTSMVGYPEILTDPSYAGQIIVMTYPMIGNYGIAEEDFEARKVFAAGLVVREPSAISSNWRSRHTLHEYLQKQRLAGFCGIDTRALARHLRQAGTMRGIIAPAPGALLGFGASGLRRGAHAQIDELPGNLVESLRPLQERAGAHPAMAGTDLVTAGHVYHWNEATVGPGASPAPGQGLPDEAPLYHVVVYDFGVKRSILRQLVAEGCRVTVVPAATDAAAVMALHPDGVLLSNGPGDPEPVGYAVDNVRELIGKVPLFGICLGHQILALALGARSYKLGFGHRGGNHPVLDKQTGKVEITSHNHGFSVDAESLPERVEITHVNLNDGTLEGLRVVDAPAFSVQYHPEAAPGPHDANHLFDRFIGMIAEHGRG